MLDEPPNWRMGETYSDLLEEMSRERAMALAKVERLEREVAGMRLPDLDDCSRCGYPMDNNDHEQGDDQWYCPRCMLTAKVERLEAKLEQQRQNSIIRPLYDNMRRAEGMEAGVRAYAWWKDGVQYVGTSGTTLTEALATLDEKAEAKEQT